MPRGALGAEAKVTMMLIDVMRSTCRRPAWGAPRFIGVLALCAGSGLAPELALAQRAPASPLPAAAPGAASPAPAEPSRLIVQQADAAFRRGRSLLERGRYEEACEQFALSQLLDPSPGTLLNLGNCREREGDLVQALATFEQALDGAREARDPRRRQLWREAARERIASLERRVAQVAVRGAPEGARVAIDDRLVEAAAGPLRINPGLHRLEVSAPGLRAFVRSFESAPGQALTIDVPPLGADAAALPMEAEQGQGSPPRYGAWPYVLGGVGAVLLGASVVTGVTASAARGDLERGCSGNVCDPSLEPTRDRAERLAALTDVLWITGVVAAGAGVTLFVLDLGREQGRPALEAGCFGSGCGLRALGSF